MFYRKLFMGVSHGEALLTKMSERKLGEAVGSWVLLAAMRCVVI